MVLSIELIMNTVIRSFYNKKHRILERLSRLQIEVGVQLPSMTFLNFLFPPGQGLDEKRLLNRSNLLPLAQLDHPCMDELLAMLPCRLRS
jgi:hypothetical protein